jgi:hypothetical protein
MRKYFFNTERVRWDQPLATSQREPFVTVPSPADHHRPDDDRYCLWPEFGQEVAMESPQALRERAEHYRRLAPFVNDEQTLAALRELVDLYEALAARIEATGGSAKGQD